MTKRLELYRPRQVNQATEKAKAGREPDIATALTDVWALGESQWRN